jgi:hypothetical protein
VARPEAYGVDAVLDPGRADCRHEMETVYTGGAGGEGAERRCRRCTRCTRTSLSHCRHEFVLERPGKQEDLYRCRLCNRACSVGAHHLGHGWEHIFEFEVPRGIERKDPSMNATRCKMKLTSISESYNNGRSVKFVPVTGGSEENKRFYAATPSGQIEFTVSAEAAKSLNLDTAALGTEFYVDIAPAAPAA